MFEFMNLYAHSFANYNSMRLRNVLQRRLHSNNVLYMKSTNDRRGSHVKLRRRDQGMIGRFGKPQERAKLEDFIIPQLVPIQTHNKLQFDGVNTNLTRQFISTILDQFAKRPHIRDLAKEQKISDKIFDKAFQSFRLHCCSTEEHISSLEPALTILFSDIQKQEQSVDTLYPYFLKHAHKVFPHLGCIGELQKISDLTKPHNWYPLARTIHRKIIFHAGPTNSGKTYEALQVLKNANSGMYGGPLRLLASEVYERMNKEGIACDLVTGERRLYASGSDIPASHCAFTVEMISPNDRRDVCVIDEIQMLRDNARGAAWTKALLGAAVDELHLCGEEAAINIVERLLDPIGEHVDIRRYKRKGDLIVISTHGLRNLENVEDGDCIIHFNKSSIFQTAKKLKMEHGKNSAIIFGDLPPETKRQQISRFNDPNDPIKVLLATDAIGMGMNLNIKRIIFSTLLMNNGKIFPSYFVKQIAGRAGRFNSLYCTGEVMTMRDDEAKLLNRMMKEPIQDVEKAGIGPSYDMIETFAMHLPHCSLVQLIEIFVSIATISDDFFVSMSAQLSETANLIDHIPLSLRDRWFFCVCPINAGNNPFLNSAYIKMVRRYSQGNAITIDWMRTIVDPIMKPANNLTNLQTLVDAYDFISSYLWLSYKFEDYFIHRDSVNELQSQCAELINESIKIMLKIGEEEEYKKVKRIEKEFLMKRPIKRSEEWTKRKSIDLKSKSKPRDFGINPAFTFLAAKLEDKNKVQPPQKPTPPVVEVNESGIDSAFKTLEDKLAHNPSPAKK